MSRQPFLAAILGFSLVNGMFSPGLVATVSGGLILLVPWLVTLVPQLFVVLVNLVGATLTMMIAGIPAAIYERAAGLTDSNLLSMWIWLAATALLSIPAVVLLLQLGF
jgi:hypothetical protein